MNGYPKVQSTWSRAIGYVEQTDIHSAATTVEEALFFSARMRLPAGNSDAQVLLPSRPQLLPTRAHARAQIDSTNQASSY